ncbi:MAG: glycoside hydrolase [Gemmatimonadetes bacterium]|nr:MAG: glycoside hydrolase [Gemmatimonadota bacterium]
MFARGVDAARFSADTSVMSIRSFLIFVVTALAVGTSHADAQRTATPRAATARVDTAARLPLDRSFRTPPDDAKPRVWWHWMNGNVTREGITADLEWMKRVGIGGMQMFDGSLGTPQFVENRLVWMTPAWKAAFRHAAAEANRLGLEMTMAASGGWSETGGPWVKPTQAMKKVVWSDTTLEGPRRFTGTLPRPPSNNGPFQGMRNSPGLDFPTEKDLPGAKPIAEAPEAAPDPTFYADTKVLAYRLPDSNVTMRDANPRVTTASGEVNAALLMDGDFGETLSLAIPDGAQETWVQFEFPTPFHAEAFTFAGAPALQFVGAPPIPQGRLEWSDDGKEWATLVTLPGDEATSAMFPARTYNFEPATARFYRVVMKPHPPNPFGAAMGVPQAKAITISELELSSAPRVNRWQEKALYGILNEYGPALATLETDPAIPVSGVVDLTARLRPNGTLDWTVPAGRWAVLRLGYSLEGTKNHPASPEATGYEVDKLNRLHVSSYIDRYTSQIKSALGPLYGKSFRYLLLDSYEAGMENWTDDMIAQFKTRRGYDPTRYLPVLTGRVVGTAAESDKFLWDYRRTIADLFADNHYGTIADALRKQGLGLYAEAMGADFPTHGEGLQDKGRVGIPMAEFWTPGPGQDDGPNHIADMREAASAGHIYGKPIVAAESFTTMPPPMVPAFSQSPYYLKRLADRALVNGINRFVIHTSVHQPFVDDEHKPGMTLGFFGQHFTRNTTWAEQAVGWTTYLARASHLLQQGRFVADLAYFYGEGAPNAVPYWKKVDPVPPAGYDYDWVNAEVILGRMKYEGGALQLPGGMRYRALVLPADVTQLTLPMVRKLRDLVYAGATLIAPPPVGTPSLSDGAAGDDSVQAIASIVWGDIDGKNVTSHEFGLGKVYWGRPVADVLAAADVAPDVSFRGASDAKLAWIHRRTPDADIWFVANQQERPEQVTASFRLAAKIAELWDASTGATTPATYTSANGRTEVPIALDPYGSIFVVFRRGTTATERTIPPETRATLATLPGPWTVTFQPGRGAPTEPVRFDALTSWSKSSDAGVRYFSGTATYAFEIDAPAEAFRPGNRIELDLGGVKEIAEVRVNGEAIGGVLWKPPYRADITDALVRGTNRVEVLVTNLWPNRMIGDLQPGVTQTYTFTDFRPFTKDSPLLESGLLGPMKLDVVQRAEP